MIFVVEGEEGGWANAYLIILYFGELIFGIIVFVIFYWVVVKKVVLCLEMMYVECVVVIEG